MSNEIEPVTRGLELEVRECGEFSVDCDLAGVPLDRDNLVVRAFETLHSADSSHPEV